VASHPLRVEEITDFLAFDFEEGPLPEFREDWRPDGPVEAILSTCCSLLAVVDVDGSRIIQFSHFLVKEFLTSTRLVEAEDTVTHHFHVLMTPTHTLMAQACLGILLYLNEDVTSGSLENYPLTEYAALGDYGIEEEKKGEGGERREEEKELSGGGALVLFDDEMRVPLCSALVLFALRC